MEAAENKEILPRQSIAHVALVVRDYDFEDLYGNRWDLVQYA